MAATTPSTSAASTTMATAAAAVALASTSTIPMGSAATPRAGADYCSVRARATVECATPIIVTRRTGWQTITRSDVAGAAVSNP